MNRTAFIILVVFTLVGTHRAGAFASTQPGRTLPSGISSGLVAYYPFDGNADDASGNGNDAVPDGPVLTTDHLSVPNSAYLFNGVSDKMRIADPEELKFTGSMSIACWAFPTSSPIGRFAAQIVLRGDDRIGLDPYYLAVMPSGRLRFWISSGPSSDYIEAPIVYGSWQHYAATLDSASGVMKLYLDGVQVASKGTSVRPFRDLDPAESPVVGVGNTGSFMTGTNHQPFDGKLDELRFYNRALTSTDVATLALETLADGLVAYYDFQGNAKDRTENGNDAIPDGPILFMDRNGTPSSAYYFNGVDAKMRVPDAAAFKLTGSMSISCWAKPLSTPTGRAHAQIFFRGDDRPGIDPYYLALEQDGNLRFHISSGTTDVDLETPIEYGEWQHYAATLDSVSGAMKLYVNGVLAASRVTVVRPFAELASALSPGIGIGNTQSYSVVTNHQPFDGPLDEIRLYNRTLTGAEILMLADQVQPPALFSITVTSTGSGSIDPDGVVIVAASSSQSFTLTPAAGHHVSALFVDDVHVDSTTGYTFSNILTNHSLHGVFEPDTSRVLLTVTNGPNTRDVAFGVRVGAANGIFRVDPAATEVDSTEGESELPAPFPGTFDTRFVAPPGTGYLFGGGSWVDVRRPSGLGQSYVYTLRFQAGVQTDSFTLRWSPELVSGAFEADVVISEFGIDMKLVDSAVLPPSTEVITIVVGQPDLPILYRSGWNIVSVPFNLQAPRSTLYPYAASDAFSFAQVGGYYLDGTLDHGKGYWLKFNGVVSDLGFDGDTVSVDTIPLHQGWNMIGSITVPVDVSSLVTDPPGILDGPFWKFENGYTVSDSIKPARGYWVKSTGEGVLYITSTAEASPVAAVRGLAEHDVSTLTIEDANKNRQVLYFGRDEGLADAYELPPVPPAGIFDVRFNNQSKTALVTGKSSGEFGITISSAVYPVWLSWDNRTAGLRARLTIGGIESELGGIGEVSLPGEVGKLRLSFADAAIPTAYALCAAYPNPFNPITHVGYSLPFRSHIRLRIFNTLGEMVASLEDGEKNAGVWEVEWNASGFSSGVYFYSLEALSLEGDARTFNQSKKIVLLK